MRKTGQHDDDGESKRKTGRRQELEERNREVVGRMMKGGKVGERIKRKRIGIHSLTNEL